MIKIVCHMKVMAEKVDDFKAVAKEIVEKSSAESGNISYTLNQNIKNPQELTMIEVWKDQTAINEHNTSEHFTRILPQMVAMCEAAPAIHLYNEVTF